ncbi:hypothetical protein HGI47_08745 [Novosphingobium sp. ERN07]|nr:hypothetical protein [Novosphingobium sp. ERN07]
MDNDDVEGLIGPLRREDHFLEYGPVLVERRSARLGEGLDHLHPLLFAPCPTLGDLVGQRQVVVGLPCSGNTGVDCSADHLSVASKQDGVNFLREERAPDGDLPSQRRGGRRQVSGDDNVSVSEFARPAHQMDEIDLSSLSRCIPEHALCLQAPLDKQSRPALEDDPCYAPFTNASGTGGYRGVGLILADDPRPLFVKS